MRRFLLAILLLAPLSFAQQPPAGSIAFAPETLVWKEGPPSLPKGAKVAVLEGDPKSNAIFTMRVMIPAGSTLPPHWHPRDERVTVISGVAELGFGKTVDRRTTRRLPAGSFYVNPPNAVHYIYFPVDTVLQLTCVGPWELHTVDEPAKAPQSVPPPAPSTTTPLPVTSTAPTPAAAPQPASVAIRNVSIRPQTMVSARSTIDFMFDYDVTGTFRPDAFAVVLQFDSNTPGHTFVQPIVRYTRATAANGPKADTLEAAHGTKEFPYDLRNIWYAAELKRPLRVRITVQDGARILGTSDWAELRERD